MVDQVLTVRCKLNPSDRQINGIEDTLKAFADACAWINQNVDPKVKGGIKMQYLIYQDVRETFGLSANLTIQAIRRVASNRKTAGKNKIEEFKPTSISYEQRIFQYRQADEQVTNPSRYRELSAEPVKRSETNIGNVYKEEIWLLYRYPSQIGTSRSHRDR